MSTCRICGEDKPASHFKTIKDMTAKKKLWCKACQKMWVESQKVFFKDSPFLVIFKWCVLEDSIL